MLAEVNGALVFGIAALIIYIVVLWVALVFRMVRDARQRSETTALPLTAGVIGLALPFLGYVVYLALRPPRTLDEERSLMLEEQALTELPDEDETRPCPTCGREIEPEFVVCPYCRTQFARRCPSCQRWLRLGWRVCPYCAEEVGRQGVGPTTGQAVSS